eukprot:scaffold149519_cov42-Prasinocladus_malaysianus.AAC.1
MSKAAFRPIGTPPAHPHLAQHGPVAADLGVLCLSCSHQAQLGGPRRAARCTSRAGRACLT